MTLTYTDWLLIGAGICAVLALLVAVQCLCDVRDARRERKGGGR